MLRGVNREAQRYGFTGIEFATELALAEFATKTKHGVEAKRKFLPYRGQLVRKASD